MTEGTVGPERPIIRRGRDGRPDLEPGRRLFIAVPVPETISRLVEELVGRIRAEEGEAAPGGTGNAAGAGNGAGSGGAAGAGRMPNRVRWVSLADLHLTVRFLGPTLDDRLDALRAAVSAAAAEVAPFTIAIGGGGAFPTIERPRAIWLGVADPAGGMPRLAAAVGSALAAAGWPTLDRPYNPHLTLARSDGVRSGPRVARRLVAAAQGLEASFEVDRLVLYESHTGGGPARYEPLHVVALGS